MIAKQAMAYPTAESNSRLGGTSESKAREVRGNCGFNNHQPGKVSNLNQKASRTGGRTSVVKPATVADNVFAMITEGKKGP